jgi:hypothetical protein
VTVTAAAIPMVRKMMERYAGFSMYSLKLSRFHTRSMFVVNELILQNAVMSRTASDAR